jgi:hypothetical protein
MAAVERELIEQIHRLAPEQQQQVLAFVQHLAALHVDLEDIERTTAQDQARVDVPPMTPAELVAWLEANPPSERWGDLRDDEDASEYIHRTRRN